MQKDRSLASFRIGETVFMPPEFKEFRELRVMQHFSSHNRVVARVCDNGGTEFVLKVMGEKHALSEQEVKNLRADTRQYKNTLLLHGIRVPGQVILEQIEIQDRHLLIELTPYCGTSLEETMRSGHVSDEDALTLSQIGLDQLRDVFRRSRGNILPVGIDMVPRNFAVDGEDVVYVDLMPPKIWRTPLEKISGKTEMQLWQHVSLEFPEVQDMGAGIAGFKRHFTKNGVLVVWLTQLAKLRPHLYLHLQAMVEQWLDNTNQHEALEVFQTRLLSTIARTGTPRDLHSAIMQSGLTDIYTLREAACLLAHRDGFEDVESVFNLTHFQHERPSAQSITEAKALLLNAITFPAQRRVK